RKRPPQGKETIMKGYLSALLGAGVLLSAFVPSPAGQTGPTGLAGKAHAVLKKHCAQCHGDGGSKKGGMNYILDRDQLVERGQVVPGNIAASHVYQRILHGEMPPAKQPRLSADEITALRQWIEAQAPTWTSASGKPALVSQPSVA